MANRYDRFALNRPDYLSEAHWESISTEVDRLSRSLDADDAGQVLADAKCLVESIAKVAHEIAGEPASDSLRSVVARAHELLRTQPGHELERTSLYGQVATWANRMAQQLGDIRNELGAGHGRAQLPHVRSEAVDLALDGGLVWSRWALRRLGLFSEGRPEPLIRDLVEERKVFKAGVLKRRLEAANLAALEPHHQRALGVAVGQRVMQQTFVVREDGLEPALMSDNLATWPPDYRVGLATGLLLDPQGFLTITRYSIDTAMTLLDPIGDDGTRFTELVEKLEAVPRTAYSHLDDAVLFEASQLVSVRAADRPAFERVAHERLSRLLDPTP